MVDKTKKKLPFQIEESEEEEEDVKSVTVSSASPSKRLKTTSAVGSRTTKSSSILSQEDEHELDRSGAFRAVIGQYSLLSQEILELSQREDVSTTELSALPSGSKLGRMDAKRFGIISSQEHQSPSRLNTQSEHSQSQTDSSLLANFSQFSVLMDACDIVCDGRHIGDGIALPESYQQEDTPSQESEASHRSGPVTGPPPQKPTCNAWSEKTSTPPTQVPPKQGRKRSSTKAGTEKPAKLRATLSAKTDENTHPQTCISTTPGTTSSLGKTAATRSLVLATLSPETNDATKTQVPTKETDWPVPSADARSNETASINKAWLAGPSEALGNTETAPTDQAAFQKPPISPRKQKKMEREKELRQARELAQQAAKLAAQTIASPLVQKNLLLSMALVRINPRTAPSEWPSRGSTIPDGFQWGKYPPLETILRSHMRDYYELSITQCQSKLQQQFNNDLTVEIRAEADKHGWSFSPTFTDRILRDRIRCFYKTHLQNAKKRLRTMVKNPTKKSNASALVAHLALIQRYSEGDELNRPLHSAMEDNVLTEIPDNVDETTMRKIKPDILEATTEDIDPSKVTNHVVSFSSISLFEHEL
jgi:hypothetical protein